MKKSNKNEPQMTPGARYPGDPWDDRGKRQFMIGLIILILVTVVAIVFQSGQSVSGKWVFNTPMPTATPNEREVLFKIEKVDYLVDGFTGDRTQLIVKVLRDPHQSDLKGTRWLLTMTASDYSDLFDKEGSKIKLICYGYVDRRVFCNRGYKITD